MNKSQKSVQVRSVLQGPDVQGGDKIKRILSKDTLQVPLAWLGALPEAVVRARKEGATDDDVIRFQIISRLCRLK